MNLPLPGKHKRIHIDRTPCAEQTKVYHQILALPPKSKIITVFQVKMLFIFKMAIIMTIFTLLRKLPDTFDSKKEGPPFPTPADLLDKIKKNKSKFKDPRKFNGFKS